MTTCTVITWEPPEPTHLPAWEAIHWDFRLCRTYMESALELLQPGGMKTNRDPWALHAFMEAAVVKYARPFADGNRLKLKDDFLECLEPEQLEFHKYILGVRSRHIAHPVNLFEINQVALSVAKYGSPEARVNPIEHQGASILPFSATDLEKAMAMIDVLIAELRKRIAEEKPRLMEMAEKLTPDELAGLPQDQSKPNENPFKSRPQPHREKDAPVASEE